MTDVPVRINRLLNDVHQLGGVVEELLNFRSAMLYHGMDNLIQPGIVGRWLDSILSGNGLTEAEWELVRNSKNWNPPAAVGVQDDHLYRLQTALNLPTVATPFEEIVKAVEVAAQRLNYSITNDQVHRLKMALGIAEVSCDFETAISVASNIRGQRDVLAKNSTLEKRRQEMAGVEHKSMFTEAQLQKIHEIVKEEIQRHFEHNPPAAHTHNPGPTVDSSKPFIGVTMNEMVEKAKPTNPFDLDDV